MKVLLFLSVLPAVWITMVYADGCTSCAMDAEDNGCSDVYTPPTDFKLNPEMCDQIETRPSEEEKLCIYGKDNGYKVICNLDGMSFTCKASCGTKYDDVGKNFTKKLINNDLFKGLNTPTAAEQPHPGNLLTNIGFGNYAFNQPDAAAHGKAIPKTSASGGRSSRPNNFAQTYVPQGAYDVDQALDLPDQTLPRGHPQYFDFNPLPLPNSQRPQNQYNPAGFPGSSFVGQNGQIGPQNSQLGPQNRPPGPQYRQPGPYRRGPVFHPANLVAGYPLPNQPSNLYQPTRSNPSPVPYGPGSSFLPANVKNGYQSPQQPNSYNPSQVQLNPTKHPSPVPYGPGSSFLPANLKNGYQSPQQPNPSQVPVNPAKPPVQIIPNAVYPPQVKPGHFAPPQITGASPQTNPLANPGSNVSPPIATSGTAGSPVSNPQTGYLSPILSKIAEEAAVASDLTPGAPVAASSNVDPVISNTPQNLLSPVNPAVPASGNIVNVIPKQVLQPIQVPPVQGVPQTPQAPQTPINPHSTNHYDVLQPISVPNDPVVPQLPQPPQPPISPPSQKPTNALQPISVPTVPSVPIVPIVPVPQPPPSPPPQYYFPGAAQAPSNANPAHPSQGYSDFAPFRHPVSNMKTPANPYINRNPIPTLPDLTLSNIDPYNGINTIPNNRPNSHANYAARSLGNPFLNLGFGSIDNAGGSGYQAGGSGYQGGGSGYQGGGVNAYPQSAAGNNGFQNANNVGYQNVEQFNNGQFGHSGGSLGLARHILGQQTNNVKQATNNGVKSLGSHNAANTGKTSSRSSASSFSTGSSKQGTAAGSTSSKDNGALKNFQANPVSHQMFNNLGNHGGYFEGFQSFRPTNSATKSAAGRKQTGNIFGNGLFDFVGSG